jgi:hypothetical protein
MLEVFAATRRGAEFHVPFYDFGVVGFLRFVVVKPCRLVSKQPA